MRVRVKVGPADVEAKSLEAYGERLTLGRKPVCEVAVDRRGQDRGRSTAENAEKPASSAISGASWLASA
jgi:hypothetical protein